MIRRIGDYALSSSLFSPTIPLLYDVKRGSPDDEFHEFAVADDFGQMLEEFKLASSNMSAAMTLFAEKMKYKTSTTAK